MEDRMRNDPLPPKTTTAVERSAIAAGYATFAIVLTFIIAILLVDRRTIANATKGIAGPRAEYFGSDEFIGVLTDEPAIPPLDAMPRPTSTPVSRAELDPVHPR
jgi:hypothetical protein